MVERENIQTDPKHKKFRHIYMHYIEKILVLLIFLKKKTFTLLFIKVPPQKSNRIIKNEKIQVQCLSLKFTKSTY